MTIPLAHACFTRGLPFKFSSAFYYVLGDWVHGTPGKVLDTFAVFATLAVGVVRHIQGTGRTPRGKPRRRIG